MVSGELKCITDLSVGVTVVLSRDSDDAPIHLNSLASAGVLKAFDNTLLAAVRSADSSGVLRPGQCRLRTGEAGRGSL